MDRVIEKKAGLKGVRKRNLLIGSLLAVVAMLIAWQLVSRTTSSRLKVDSTRLTVGSVTQGKFLEYYPFDGAVEPATSVYLDIEEGGRVDQIFAEGGAHVEKGQLILRFSNVQAQRSAIDSESGLYQSLDYQGNTEFNRSQSLSLLKQQLLDLEHQIADTDAKFKRYDSLMATPNSPISREVYETTRDQLKYLKDRRDLLDDQIKREEALGAAQVARAQKSIQKLNESMELLGHIVRSLEVRAPISGFLSTIDAQVGQNIPRGQRIGQIDLLDKFKVRAHIDQFYISKVQVGTNGHVNLDGRNYDVKVQKIYPEVKSNTFDADVVFDGDTPDSLKRGQSVTVELTFGTPSQSLIVVKGGYYQQTGGRWVYLLSKDGKTARRTEVKLGRQNPREVEVLEGLREGDQIVTSGYDTYNGVDELRFSQPFTNSQEKK
jgi:HlyD family secretion protein